MVYSKIGAGAAALAVVVAGRAVAADGLRVVAWNITFYSGSASDDADIQTVTYSDFQINAGGRIERRTLAPDVFLLQEFSGQFAADRFAAVLNAAPGSPGDWDAARVYDGGSLNNAFVYRTSKLNLLDETLIAASSGSANPRNVARYDTSLVGYSLTQGRVSFIPVHMKAGSGSSDQQRRAAEAERIIDDVRTLPWPVVLGGDFNIQSSFQTAFETLVENESGTYNAGFFRDPLFRPGTWNNSSGFRNIHTQDPAGQLDDRLDMILLSAGLVDGVGLDYIGAFGTPWDLSTPEDPNHSYRVWGNDGTTYNRSLATTTNGVVSADIARSLIDLASGNGHLPVYLDLRVPAVLSVPVTSIDLGEIEAGSMTEFVVEVGNGGDAALWGAGGIEDVSFSFLPGAGLVEPPAGTFVDAAGDGLMSFTLVLDATDVEPGPLVDGVLIESNDAARSGLGPVPIVVSATVVETGPCGPADVAMTNGSFGTLDGNDISSFVAAFVAGDPAADLAATNGSFGTLDGNDVALFVSLFLAGCP